MNNRLETAKAFVQDRLRLIQSQCKSTARHIRVYHLEQLPKLKQKLYRLRAAEYMLEQHSTDAVIKNTMWQAVTQAQKDVNTCKDELKKHESEIREWKTEAKLLCMGLRELKSQYKHRVKPEDIKVHIPGVTVSGIPDDIKPALRKVAADIVKHTEETVLGKKK